MGTLIVMRYPTNLFARAADHTYVKCGTGQKAWSCWGGKTGGQELRRGTGSTKRADKIAGAKERAGIKCYLINGVCHQAANRILLPAGITVRGARGYTISEALYGPYGRLGGLFCKAPFDQHPGVTGDLPACTPPPRALARTAAPALTAEDKLDYQYIQGALALYAKAKPTVRARTASASQAKAFHQELFLHMASFHLGPHIDRPLKSRLKSVHGKTERARGKIEAAFESDEMDAGEFVAAINERTIAFQENMADALTRQQYRSLFELEPGETVVLADPEIVEREYGTKPRPAPRKKP